MFILILLALMLPAQATGWSPYGKLVGTYKFVINDISSGGTTVDITAQSGQWFLYDFRENQHYFSRNLIGFKDKSGLYLYEKYGNYGEMKGSTTYRCKQLAIGNYYCQGVKNFECGTDEQCYDVGTCYLQKQP